MNNQATFYLDAARAKKADALANLLDAHKITAADARRISTRLWEGLAKKAGVRPPSPETVAVVIAKLEAREASRALAGVA